MRDSHAYMIVRADKGGVGQDKSERWLNVDIDWFPLDTAPRKTPTTVSYLPCGSVASLRKDS